jgi:hypothetical protein
VDVCVRKHRSYADNARICVIYEDNVDFIKSLYGTDQAAWPPFIRFLWVVRNAIAHSGGVITLRNPKLPPAVWGHLSYDFNDFGKPIIGGDLGFGDLLLLLIEFGRELDQLAAPVA